MYKNGDKKQRGRQRKGRKGERNREKEGKRRGQGLEAWSCEATAKNKTKQKERVGEERESWKKSRENGRRGRDVEDV